MKKILFACECGRVGFGDFKRYCFTRYHFTVLYCSLCGWGFGVFGTYYFPGGHEVRAFISKSYYFLCAKIISRAFLLSCNLIRNKTTRRQAGQPPERFKPCPSARVTSPKYGKFSRHTWKTRNCAKPPNGSPFWRRYTPAPIILMWRSCIFP